MPGQEIADALVAEAGRIDGIRLQTGQFDDEDWGRMVEAAETLRTIPLHIDDQGALTLAQIRAKARQIKGLKVLALDYLQLCTSTLRGDKSTNDQIAEISKGLKALAMEMNIAVIVMSQLNREVERRQDKEPQLADLRDSGAIEQDLDVAVLLWTAREDDRSDGDRLVGLKVAKHRGGRKCAFGMRWRPAVNQWRESDESLRGSAAATDLRPARGFK
jgi:replicative DNA helicase